MVDKDIAEIMGDTSYEAAAPTRKRFFPWHKPRKQFVRHSQWITQIRHLVETNGNNEISYLGLPGNDLLDLRYIYDELCKDSNRSLKFLGFNTALSNQSDDATEINISLDELLKLDNISSESEILKDNFVDISARDTIAHRRFIEHGPFDVVNLDLCDCLAKHTPNTFGKNHYNATMELLSLQSRRTKPWLLFLTTKVSKEEVNKEISDIFLGIYRKNLTDCENFSRVSDENLEISLENLLESIDDRDKFLKIFVTGLCKWLFSYSLGFRPQVTGEVKSIQGYKVFDGSPTTDLISLAIMFTPKHQIAPDLFEISTPRVSIITECSLAPPVANRAGNILNVDDLLSLNDELRKEMEEQTIDLMTKARYESSKVRRWISEGCNL